MREINSDYVSIGHAAYLIDVSTITISRWYKWWENPEFEHPEGLYLPPYYYKDKRLTKHFKKTDIPALEEFGKQLRTVHKGAMAEFNAAYQWGKRGDKILKKRDSSIKEVRKKMR